MGVLKSSLSRDINSDFEKNERINDCEDRMIKTIKQSILKNSNDSDEEYWELFKKIIIIIIYYTLFFVVV